MLSEGDRLEGGEGDKSTTLVRPGTNDQLDLGAGGASAARVPSASQVPGSAAAKRSTVNSASKPSVLTPPNQNKGDSKGGKKKGRAVELSSLYILFPLLGFRRV